jgi:hypothetical protein
MFRYLVVALSISLTALGSTLNENQEITCYAVESTSNDFGILRIHLKSNTLIGSFYAAGIGDTIYTRELIEYSETTIANLKKRDKSCSPVKTIVNKESARTAYLADFCDVDDPTALISSSGLVFKIDFVKKAGSMNIKNYFYDGSIFSERSYSFSYCF